MKHLLIICALVGAVSAITIAEDDSKSDAISIVYVEPPGPVTRGVETEFTIGVKADLESADHGVALVGFNLESPTHYHMIDSHLLDRGSQEFTFKTKVVPVDWKDRGKFSVLVNIGPEKSGPNWEPTASDQRHIEVQQ